MIIPIDENIRIVGTETCWELQRVRSRKGVSVWEPFKYFGTFRQALGEAVHREIRIHPAKGITEALEATTDIVQRYSDLLDNPLPGAGDVQK